MEKMKRVKLIVAYDGTNYHGWQLQPGAVTIEQVLNEALTGLLGEPIMVIGASRTDAGVHALGQTFHFDTESSIPPEKYPFVLNTMLPRDIRVHQGRQVPPDFHARFLTCGKRYTYRICNSRHGSALRRNLCAHVPLPLDTNAMDHAAQTLLGRHDFAAFQASGGTAKTTVRTLTLAQVTRTGDDVTLLVEGDAFLYNMVRIIAGTLMEIGLGRREANAFSRALETGDRLALGVTAPACGLELTRVDYPEAAFRDPAAIRWHQE